MNPKKLVVVNRGSLLAIWQAKHIQGRLKALYLDREVKTLDVTTRDDQILDKALSKVSDKGLFIKELEQALQDGHADLTVHSIKDTPMDLPEGSVLAAIDERTNPSNTFVSNQYMRLEEMPEGTVVGTSNLRREAQLCTRYPHLVIKPLHGNVQARLSKLDNGEYDAIILAVAGLQCSELDERIRLILSEADSLPTTEQGALDIETASHRTNLFGVLKPLDRNITYVCVTVEHILARALGGNCQIPLAAYCAEEDGPLTLYGLIGHPGGSVILQADAQAPATYADALRRAVARKLADNGAQELIETALTEQAQPSIEAV